jgi:HNH endonuclease
MRERLRQLYAFRCGYCGVREVDAGSQLTIDHFRPRTHQGTDAEDNLVYCCFACNHFKSDYWQTEPERQLLHPLLDNLATHFTQTEDHILDGLTERGRNHITVLHLNRPELVDYRRLQAERQREHSEYLSLLELFKAQEVELQNLTHLLRAFPQMDQTSRD